LRKRNVRKEDRVKEILARRGEQPGLVCIFSAMEPCSTYKPWHDKQSGKPYLRPDDGKCLHYYFYFIDVELGLCFVRVCTSSKRLDPASLYAKQPCLLQAVGGVARTLSLNISDVTTFTQACEAVARACDYPPSDRPK
jgi:hypothetical protein